MKRLVHGVVLVILLTCVVCESFAFAEGPTAAAVERGFWTEPELWKSPVYQRLVEYDVGSVQAILFDSLPWKGNPTKTFAYIGFPDAMSNGEKEENGSAPHENASVTCRSERPPTESAWFWRDTTREEYGKEEYGKYEECGKYPAIVLVHVGGGTAFAHWVQLWNDRGWIAIAMDTCGSLPDGADGTPHPRHDAGGPPGWGGFDQVELPEQDQWTYHAVADVILAHSLVRSLPQVDPQRTGITGISWGGYLTCITAGVDPRFRFAVPQYGCGYLGDNSAWLNELRPTPSPDGSNAQSLANAKYWLSRWDPSVWIPSVPPTTQFLWIDGTNDLPYPLDSLQKTYSLLPESQRTLCVTIRMPHYHFITPEEIRVFADTWGYNGAGLAKILRYGVESGSTDRVFAQAQRTDTVTITEATLCYTTETTAWQDRVWSATAANVATDSDGTVWATATLPTGTTAWYINFVDNRKCTVSTPHRERYGVL